MEKNAHSAWFADVFTLSVSVVVLIVVTTVFYFRGYMILGRNKMKKYCVIPGWDAKPSDPELGDLGIAMARGGIAKYLEERHCGGKHSIIAFWWGKHRVVSVCSPRAFKETEGFFNRPFEIFGAWSNPMGGGLSVQDLNYSEWEERKKLLYNTSRGDNLLLYFQEFVEIAQGKVDDWKQALMIHLQTEIPRLLLKSVINTLFAKSCLSEDEINELAIKFDKCKEEAESRTIDSPPADSTREQTFQENLSYVESLMEKILNNRIKTCHKSEKPFPLVDALVGSKLSKDQISSDMITFLGGHHTSSPYFSYLLILLCQHPDVQLKLYQDIKKNVTDGKSLERYVFSSSTYLRQVLDEGHRLGAIAAISGHYSDDDVVIEEKYLVPGKTPILHSISTAMKNPDVWDDPHVFRPERFDKGQPHCTRGHEFRPFGIPPARRCPASQLVYLMTSVYLVFIIENFMLQLHLENSEIDMGSDRIKSFHEDVTVCLKTRSEVLY